MCRAGTDGQVIRRCTTLSAVLLVLGACAGTPGSSGGDGIEPLPAAPSGQVSSAPIAGAQGGPTPPPVPMAGRWTLASSAGGACGMNFGGSANAAEGTIAPEGGCPGNFYTSRKWTYEEAGLVIRDHTGKPLAQLAAVGNGRFAGQVAGGTATVTLSR